MRWRATHDDLTGLLNRAGFLQATENRLRTGTLSLLMLDLDGFKFVNDVYGHKAGDRVLVEVARRLNDALPENGLTARLGGDEFAVLYDPVTSGVPDAVMAANLITAVSQPFDGFDAGRLGVSIGVHASREPSLTEMLSCADEALYAAKAAGRNRYRVFDSSLRERLQMRRDLERDLSQALVENAPKVWFQPIYAGDGRTLVGLEALIRWEHPRLGWIAPPDLIAAAAMAGLTGVAAPLHPRAGLRDAGDPASPRPGQRPRGDERLPREMAQVPVDEIVIERLSLLGLPPTMLEIEITEETALDIGAVQGKLQALSRAGIRVALDDFGIGYSSLSSLRQLKADRIKIDRSFVTGLGASDDKRGLVLAVLGLGRLLGLDVVAEGVEVGRGPEHPAGDGLPVPAGLPSRPPDARSRFGSHPARHAHHRRLTRRRCAERSRPPAPSETLRIRGIAGREPARRRAPQAVRHPVEPHEPRAAGDRQQEQPGQGFEDGPRRRPGLGPVVPERVRVPGRIAVVHG